MKLEGNNISFAYKKDSPILNNISISVPDDKVIGLIGDSGSGKSTLCKILSGYIPRYEGTVTIDNNPIESKDYNPVQLIFQHPEKTMNPKWKMENILEESFEVKVAKANLDKDSDNEELKETWEKAKAQLEKAKVEEKSAGAMAKAAELDATVLKKVGDTNVYKSEDK